MCYIPHELHHTCQKDRIDSPTLFSKTKFATINGLSCTWQCLEIIAKISPSLHKLTKINHRTNSCHLFTQTFVTNHSSRTPLPQIIRMIDNNDCIYVCMLHTFSKVPPRTYNAHIFPTQFLYDFLCVRMSLVHLLILKSTYRHNSFVEHV